MTNMQKKMCYIYGFSGNDRLNAQRQVIDYGFEVTFTLANATVIIVKGAPSADLQRKAKLKKIPVMSLDDLSAVGQLTESLELPKDLQTYTIKPAVELTDTHVRILDVVLPRRQAPLENAGNPISIDAFAHLCLDQTFLKTARNVAISALYNIPCALEGETATAKTTAVRWVASLLGQPLYRVNLNGQTDTGELVGRYVPSASLPPLDEGALRSNIHSFDGVSIPIWEASRDDILRARDEGRPLNQIERARVSQALGLRPQQWGFVEGLIPKALRYGAWVVLDEMNLAEPQILERLNSVLEDERSLVLTESDHSSFGVGGDTPSHAEFRIFGTMNPAEYAGRSPLSPAFRDRWRLWSFVSLPTEEDLKAMLSFLIFGEHPVVEYDGVFYQGQASEPLYPSLQDLDEIDELMSRLAIFHYQLSQAAGDGGQAKIGRTRRERYVFTRRSLQTALKMINMTWTQCLKLEDGLRPSPLKIVADVIQMLYVARIQDPTDQAAVRAAMSAAGLRL
jgi:MoxR-like ATPase